MPNHLSILGIIHTAISVLALFAGAYCLFSDGKIVPENKQGRLYIILTIITCLTSFPIMKTGHFTGAHGLGVVVLVLLPIGIYAKSIPLVSKIARYVQVVVMSMTLFLSCIPAIVETLTRLPISNPLASGPNDPLIQKGLLVLTLTFVVGVIYQLIKLRSKKKTTQTPDGEVKLS
ncbi:hypothetical protein FO440_20310 [Mucilaginibacter corticis]|uniref:DUF2306 domain-containing protein n=1 Tax=Mucilaginibacter corticis TaxID=2597670 RepID=A0A556MG82_9SPHI|nr:hypothetical protein [Mucilaginibacter corticis]TSJ38849.1 hypothetical protein FO440_20310 [Mucilaginibacter corticis]